MHNIQLVKIQPEERLAASSELNPASCLVTGCGEARGMGYWAATQVKGLSPEIFIVPEADVVVLTEGSTLIADSPIGTWQGDASPAGSETVARYQTDIMGTREAQSVLLSGVCAIKPINGKTVQTTLWESDQFIVPEKQGNACRGKGLAGARWPGRDTPSILRYGQGVSTKLWSITLRERRGCTPEEPDEGKLQVRFCEGAHSNLGAITSKKKVCYGLYSTMGIEPFRELFYDLSKTSRSLGLWKGRLVGLDGSLIKSNTSSYKNKETGEYTDKDAGLYIRKNYIKGVGHLSYKMDDLEYGLPILIQRYKGSSNENPLYRLAIDEFYGFYGFYPKTISVDRGMDSVANNEYSVEKGIEAYLQARDFGNRELVKTEKGKCFRPEYISVNDPSFLERIADRRSECERSFSRDKCGYRRDEMSNRGAIEAELYMLITGITTHLTAITAYHVGRTDLMRSPTAFRRIILG